MKHETATETRWHKKALAVAAAASVLFIAGCTNDAQEPSAGGDADTSCGDLSFFNVNLANPWLATLGEGTDAYAAENGISMTSYDAAGDLQTQISQIQQAVANGTRGILVTPVESDGVVPAIKQANEAGIPVIAVNGAVGDGADVVTFVGVDHYDYGVGLAELALQAIPDGGKVAIIQGVVGNPAEVLRTEALNDVLGERDDVEIIAQVTDNWNNTENLAAVQDLLTRFGPGEIDVIIAEGPEIYVGAEYARSVGRDDVAFIAGDFPIQVRDAIKSGAVYGTVLQDGPIQGITALDAMCNWLAGNESAVKRPSLMLELPFVTAENVDEYETTWNW